MPGQSGVYRGRTAEDRAAERRERLLEATLTVWAEADVRTTMTAVCAAAGLTERYFYETFANLDSAQTAVLDLVAERIDHDSRAAAEAVAAAGGGPAEQVRASVAAFVDLIERDPRLGRVAIVEAGTMPALRARRQDLLRVFAHEAATRGAELFGAPPRPGPGPGPADRTAARDREIAGLLFIGGMAELVTAWLDGVLEATPAEIVEQATRMFTGLYR